MKEARFRFLCFMIGHIDPPMYFEPYCLRCGAEYVCGTEQREGNDGR